MYKRQDKGTSCSFWKQDLSTFTHPQPEVWVKSNSLDILAKYDYMYGGLRLVTDPEDSPCKPIDHYAMILNGHDECLRLGDECKWWDSDFSEYINKSTINQITLKDWHDEADRVKFYLESVSYTHLDVYKRQILTFTSKIQMPSLILPV